MKRGNGCDAAARGPIAQLEAAATHRVLVILASNH
jgi:hypothetical protein